MPFSGLFWVFGCVLEPECTINVIDSEVLNMVSDHEARVLTIGKAKNELSVAKWQFQFPR